MSKRRLAAVVAAALCVLTALPPSALAADIEWSGHSGKTPVTLETEAAAFRVTVPMALPVRVAADGTVTCADDVEIVNDGAGPVAVTAVTVQPQSGWTLDEWGTDYRNVPTNAQRFCMCLQGQALPTDGVADAACFETIGGHSSLSVDYAVDAAVQSAACEGVTLANVTFTVGWEEAPPYLLLSMARYGCGCAEGELAEKQVLYAEADWQDDVASLPDVGTQWYQLREGEFVTILPAQWTLDAVLAAQSRAYGADGVTTLEDDMEIRADLDGSGRIDGTDVSLESAFLSGRTIHHEMTDLDYLKMDVNLDKVVNTDDLIIIMEYVVGLRG